MKSIVPLVLAVLCGGTAAAQTTGRLFFDLAGNGGNQSAPHPGGLAMTNPELPPGGGRLYLYWQFGVPGPNPAHSVIGLNYNVTVDNGSISQAMNYQCDNAVGLGVRWQDVPGNPAPNPAANPGGNTARFTAVNINAFGLENDTAHRNLDQGYNAVSNTTILGYVDVSGEGPVWITVDTLGIAIQHGGASDWIYMGFGDEPVPAGGSPGRRSQIPEAHIIPEPATLALFGLGATLCGLRRRLRARC